MKGQLEEICKRHRIEIMYAFGSRCKELKRCIDGQETIQNTISSDVDLGVVMCKDPHLSVRGKARLIMELEDLFRVARVDLVILPEADPFLAANIIRGERLCCEDSHKADEYELYILRRAGDLAPLERERLSLIFGER